MSNHPSNFQTVRAQSMNSGRKKSHLPWVLGCMGGIVLLLVVAAVAVFAYFSMNKGSQSIVLIREPLNSSSLQIGEPVTLRAVANGENKITQIELWVDDQLVDFQTSEIPGGIAPFPIISTWIPTQAGVHTISARSTDITGKQSVNQITVDVLENADRDGDLVPDHLDQCPEQPGTDGGKGCMDADFDGIPDEVDACPEIAGLPEDGCPSPSENDRDGDGVIDERDACPDEAGTPLADGCLDRDGDGFADAEDPCPDEAGTIEACPSTGDMDSDGILDGEDACPTSYGSADMAGCADSDGDGILDHEDACPETAGSAENRGCPAMSGGVLPPPPAPEDDDSGSAGLSFGDMGFELSPPIPIELRGKTFYMEETYDSIWVYITVFDYPPQRYDFDTSDGHYWNIEEVLGGANSINIMHNEDEPLYVRLSGMGQKSTGETEDLFYYYLVHPSTEWNGQSMMLEPDNGSFRLEYQICTPSCDNLSLPAPRLAPVTTDLINPGSFHLRWQWDGNNEDIDGFMTRIFVDGEPIGTTYIQPSTNRSIMLTPLSIQCGATYAFDVFAFDSVDDEYIYSPVSNREFWTTAPCMFNAIVTFQSLDMHSPQNDEGGQPCMGPVWGFFSAGSPYSEQTLNFNARWVSSGGHRSDGLWLCEGTHHITDIFNWVHSAQASCSGVACHSLDYSAPTTSTVHISLAEDDDIIVCSEVNETDTPVNRNPGETIFRACQTIPFNELSIGYPTRFAIDGDVANLVVVVELQDAP